MLALFSEPNMFSGMLFLKFMVNSASYPQWDVGK